MICAWMETSSAEIGSSATISFGRSARALAIPIPDPEIQSKRRIVALAGEIPSPVNPPSGCRFHTRCPIAQLPTPCADQEPPLEQKARDHRAACFFSEKVPVAV